MPIINDWEINNIGDFYNYAKARIADPDIDGAGENIVASIPQAVEYFNGRVFCFQDFGERICKDMTRNFPGYRSYWEWSARFRDDAPDHDEPVELNVVKFNSWEPYNFCRSNMTENQKPADITAFICMCIALKIKFADIEDLLDEFYGYQFYGRKLDEVLLYGCARGEELGIGISDLFGKYENTEDGAIKFTPGRYEILLNNYRPKENKASPEDNTTFIFRMLEEANAIDEFIEIINSLIPVFTKEHVTYRRILNDILKRIKIRDREKIPGPHISDTALCKYHGIKDMRFIISRMYDGLSVSPIECLTFCVRFGVTSAEANDVMKYFINYAGVAPVKPRYREQFIREFNEIANIFTGELSDEYRAACRKTYEKYYLVDERFAEVFNF